MDKLEAGKIEFENGHSAIETKRPFETPQTSKAIGRETHPFAKRINKLAQIVEAAGFELRSVDSVRTGDNSQEIITQITVSDIRLR